MSTISHYEEALPALMCKQPVRFEGMSERQAQKINSPVETELVRQLKALEDSLRKQGYFETRANVNCYVYAGWVWPDTLRQRVACQAYTPSDDFTQFVHETHSVFEENRMLN